METTPLAQSPPLPCSALFEAVDASGDEYYTIGIWPTLKEAVEAIMSCVEPSDLGSDGEPEEYCLVEIRQRNVGFGGAGKVVWKRTWKMSVYEDESCNYTWTSEVESLLNVRPLAPADTQTPDANGNP